MSNKPIPFKQGDSFVLEGAVTEANLAKDMTGWSVVSELRSRGALVCTLTFAWVNQTAGTYRLSALPAATRNWPVAVLDIDVQYTSPSGQVTSTVTFQVSCAADCSLGA